jgi:hypothetical protein
MVDPAHLAYQKWKKAFSDQLSALNNGFVKKGGRALQLTGYRVRKVSTVRDSGWVLESGHPQARVSCRLTVLTAATVVVPKSACNLPLIITKGRIPNASGMAKTI